MQRRSFIIALYGLVAAGPLARRVRAADAPVRIGFQGNATTPAGQALVDCFRAGLRNAGWIEGQNVTIDYEYTEGVEARNSVVALDIVRAKPDVIVTTGTPGTQAMQRAAGKIPIVFMSVSDPVASGIVASLARPGGNVTGVSNFFPSMTGKLLELLKTAAPQISRVGIIYNPDNPGKILEVHALQAAGKTLGMSVALFEVHAAGDFVRAFAGIMEAQCQAVVTLQEGVTLANRSRIVGFAQENKLPAIYQIRQFVESGGLMSYGVNYCAHYRRGAYYVDRILKGAKPEDLPVELPDKFELVINLKAAKALGLTIPPTLLATADDLIE